MRVCEKDRKKNKILLPSGLESQPMGIIKRKIKKRSKNDKAKTLFRSLFSYE